MKVIWRTSMSMDGKIASADEKLDFLETIADRSGALADFPAFLKTMDAIIVGAGTLRWAIASGHAWPRTGLPTWLVSHQPSLEKQIDEKNVRRVEGELGAMLTAMENNEIRRVWLAGGGDVAGQLLLLDRIDQVEVTIAPAAVGAGPSLFGNQALALKAFDLVGVSRVAGNAVRATWQRPSN